MKKRNLVKIHEGGISWEEAIHEGVKLLVENQIASIELADEIIKSTNQMGPYYILMDKLALAHTHFGKFNHKVGISLVIFEKPIKFSEQERHKVNLLFTLSAIDSDSHMQLIQNFANTFKDKSKVDQILREKDIEKIYELLEGVF